MMDDIMPRDEVQKLLDGATEGPWVADGDPQNRIVWSPDGNRVCFMAHSSGLNDDRDVATSNLTAAAPALARSLLAAHDEIDRLRADALAAQALLVERAAQEAEDHGEPGMYQGASAEFRSGYEDAGEHIAESIRALAPDTGVKALAELRAERDALETAREMLGGFWAKDNARAEAAEAALARLREEQDAMVGAVIEEAARIGGQTGSLMSWERRDAIRALRPAATAALARYRNAVLEEAATLLESLWRENDGYKIAQVRALKTPGEGRNAG